MIQAQGTIAFLRTICADRYGTPDRKLPDCPRCEEDELWAHPNHTGFSCYRCRWTVEIEVPRTKPHCEGCYREPRGRCPACDGE